MLGLALVGEAHHVGQRVLAREPRAAPPRPRRSSAKNIALVDAARAGAGRTRSETSLITPEGALRADQQLAQAGPGGARRARARSEISAAGAARRRPSTIFSIAPVAGGGLPGRAGGRAAAERHVLEGLRVVPEREPARARGGASSAGARIPPWTVDGRATAGRARARSPCRRVSSATTARVAPASGATPPTTLVPPPNGTTASERASAQARSSGHHLLVRAREDDRVRRALGRARRASAPGRGSPCRPRGGRGSRCSALTPSAPRIARSAVERRSSSARRAAAPRAPSATGGRGRSPTPDVLAQVGERARPPARAAGQGLPSPTSASPRAGGRSATDPGEAVERLVERVRGRAADHEAAEAREEAGRAPGAARSSPRWPPAPRPVASHRLSGRGRASGGPPSRPSAARARTACPPAAGPSAACARARRCGRGRSRRARVCPCWSLNTSVKAPPSTSSTRVTRGHQRGRWWGSPISSHRSSGGAAIVRLRRAVGTDRASLGLVGEHARGPRARRAARGRRGRRARPGSCTPRPRRRGSRRARTGWRRCRPWRAGRRAPAPGAPAAARRCAARAARSRTRAGTRR